MTILELQYADDNALVTHAEEDLQAAVDAFSYAYNALGLTLNARKTQVLFQPSLITHTGENSQRSQLETNALALLIISRILVVTCHARQIWMLKLKFV